MEAVKTIADTVGKPGTQNPHAREASEVELCEVIDQTSRREITILTKDNTKEHYIQYHKVFKRMPPVEKECTAEQLSGLWERLSADVTPHVDMAIWRPFGQRHLKQQQMDGLTLSGDGTLRRVEIRGPPSFYDWNKCYELLQTGLIGFNAVDLGSLFAYLTRIRRYHDEFGDSFWALIYQADVRCRLEEMERIRRDIVTRHDKTVKAGHPDLVDFEAQPSVEPGVAGSR